MNICPRELAEIAIGWALLVLVLAIWAEYGGAAGLLAGTLNLLRVIIFWRRE